MDDHDEQDHLQRLRREIESELDARSDVTGFEFRSTEDPGVHVAVDEAEGARLYHVTLEHLPDDTVETHWSYLGQVDGD